MRPDRRTSNGRMVSSVFSGDRVIDRIYKWQRLNEEHRPLQVPAREHSTRDELDTNRNEPYRAIDRNRALIGKTYP